MTADNSYDIGIIADIDNDDSDSENHRAVGSVADSDSSLPVNELASQIEEAFGHDSSAPGRLLTTFYVFVFEVTTELTL